MLLSWYVVPKLLVQLNIQAPSAHDLQKCLAVSKYQPCQSRPGSEEVVQEQ